ncbi:hypothetical protein ACP4OV_008429 [Aristida adscensionis]
MAADPPPALTLLVEKGPRKGQTLQCRAGAVARVGRVVRGNDLALGDAGASQRHLDLAFLPPPAARWAATDLGSSNGTLLNGAPLVPSVPAPLSDGDRIKIGASTVLAVSIISAPVAGPDPAGPRRSGRHAAAAVESKPPAAPRRGGRRKAAAAVVEEPPEAEEEEAVAVPRRGGGKKAAEPAQVEAAEEEEAPVVPRRGGRKKAAEPAEVDAAEEEDEEEAPVVTRRGRKKAAPTAAPPLPPPKTRSGRAAARRDEAVETGQIEQEGVKTRRGRGGRATRASARKAKDAVPEEDEAEVDAPRDQPENPPSLTASKGGEDEDKVATGHGTSNASEEVVPVARSGRAKKTVRGRGRATRASARNAKDAVVEEDNEEEEEKGEVAAAGEHMSDTQRVTAEKGVDEDVDEVPIRAGEVNGTLKPSMEVEVEVPLVQRGQKQISEKEVASSQLAGDDTSASEEDKGHESGSKEVNCINQELGDRMAVQSGLDGVGEEEDGKEEATGSRGKEDGDRNVEKHNSRSSIENMTVGEWLDRMEKYLLAKNHEIAEKAIEELTEKHLRFLEYLSTLK